MNILVTGAEGFVGKNLAAALKNENYWETGRTLDKLGLSGMSKEEIKDYVLNGCSN